MATRERTYSLYTRTAAALAIAGGVIPLLGWMLDIEILRGITPGAVSIKPNSAISFILLGLSLWILSDRAARGVNTPLLRLARACAAIVTIGGLMTLAEYAFGIGLGIDEPLFKATLARTGLANPGRMATATAFDITLFGSALLLLDAKLRGGRRPAQCLAVIGALIGVIGSLGYAYDVPELYHLASYSAIALPAAIIFMIIGAGILFARADRGLMAILTSHRSGGIMARRMLPLAILLPFIIGWIRLEGERAGLYGTTFGLALFTTANIVTFAIAIWFSARKLNRIDAERQRAEDSLRASEARFRALIERSAEGVVLIDRNGAILYHTPSVATIEGYAPDELLGRDSGELDHPDDLPMLRERFETLLANPGVTVGVQWRRWHKEGHWIWLEGFAANHLDDPNVRAIVSNYRDITDRKQAEEALRESEQRFAKSFHASPVGMALVRLADLRYVDANDSWLRMIGYSRDEVVGNTAPALGVTERGDRENRIDRLHRTGSIVDDDVVLRTKDGATIHTLVSAQLVTVNSEPHIIGVYVDITDRKRAEEALRESEERFSKSFHSSPAGMTLVRLDDLRYVDVNSSWLDIVGYDRDEVIGHTADEVSVVTAEAREKVLEAIRTSGGLMHADITLRTKQGELRPCILSSQLVTMGSVPYLIAVYADITERKRAEEEKRLLEAQLLQSQKMEALGTLSSGIAHDFNNILTAILGNAKLAREHIGSDDAAQRNLGEIYNAGVRAADLVRRILSFSRRQEPDRRVIHLQPVVDEAAELLRATMPARIELRTDRGRTIPDVSADAGQIHQVIMNLGTNAAHAMEDRGGVIEITLEAIDVDAELARASADLHEGRYVRLSVIDNGSGMDQGVLRRIYEPFFTTKEIGKGTGLGLSVVHGIVQSHEGAMVVTSEHGKGTTVRIYLPAVEEQAAEPPVEIIENESGHGERLLYVDDEPALVTLFTLLLNQLGYTVTGFTNPATALEEFSARPRDFDIVVTDLSMPGISGPELARRMLEIREDLPIVLMSGFMPESEIEEARRIGIRAFVSKPATAQSLEHTLREVIEG
jgi:PAS domain S-box-containing protein